MFVLCGNPANYRHPNRWDRVVQCEYRSSIAKDHERMGHVGEVIVDYGLSITTGDNLANMFHLSAGENIMMETRDDGVFYHNEVDIIMVSLFPRLLAMKIV